MSGSNDASAGGSSGEWSAFLERHRELVRQTGLPASVTETESRWIDFLRDGRTDSAAGGITAGELSPESYPALVDLATRFFDEGNLFFTPMALRTDDQARLTERFGGPQSRPPG